MIGLSRPAGVLLARVHIVDVVAGSARPGAIWVRQGRIMSTDAAAARAALEAGAAAVDMGGAFISPGLINMHTHLSLSLPGELGELVDSLDAPAMALYMAEGARRTLEAGVTTVRCVAEVGHLEFTLREAIARGWARGPRILTAGRALVAPGGHASEHDSTMECSGPEGFAEGVRAQARAGADLIKVMLSGGISDESDSLDRAQLTSAEIAAVLDTAHSLGLKVTAHAGPAAVIGDGLDRGLDCVEHGYRLTPEIARRMVDRGVPLVPTLLVSRCGEFLDELGVPGWMQRKSLDAGPRHLEAFIAAVEAGVTILMGSDMPPFWHFEGTTASVREIEHIAAHGGGAVSALQSATVLPAEWLGLGDVIGRVEPGMMADLIATDTDPTLDISALRRIHWVMAGGQVVRDDGA